MFDVNVANQLGLTNSSASTPRLGKPDLTQADFLRLMTQQLKNQDPLKPLSNAEFVSQMAQMSTSQGVEKLNTSMATLAGSFGSDMALRAAPLIGRTALVSSENLVLAAGPDGQLEANGVLAAPGSGPLTVDIVGPDGQLVRRIQINATGPGEVPFQWDGLDQNGAAVPPGRYGMQATFGTGSSTRAVETGAIAPIESVTLSPQGLILNLTGLGAAPLTAIRRLG